MNEQSGTKSSTDEIKLKFVQRIMLLAFGFIAACVLIGALPVLAFASGGISEGEPIRVDSDDRYATEGRESSGPAVQPPQEVIGRANASSDSLGGLGIFIPIAILLSLIYALGYGLYDMFRLFMQYRKARDLEEVMFP